MIGGVSVIARLALFAVVSVRVVQTVLALAIRLIAASRVVHISVAITLTRRTGAASLERISEVVYSALFASRAHIAFLAVADHAVYALVKIARGAELIAESAAWAHAFFAYLSFSRSTIKAIFASLTKNN